MTHVPRFTILLLSENAATRQGWAQLFAGHNLILSAPDKSLPTDVDLLITDSAPLLPALANFPHPTAILHLTSDTSSFPPTLEPTSFSATKAFGVTMLPTVEPAELFRTARLLLEVVHLRRRLHQSQAQSTLLAHEAATDPLTGLPNRRAWQNQLDLLDNMSEHTRTPSYMALLDLDHFKRINDVHGHDAGDQLLRAVASTLRATLRHDDFLARLGGDEFAILFHALVPRDAPTVLERIRHGLTVRLVDAGQVPITASAGYALLGNQTSDAAYRAADAALRAAKLAGRNRTQPFQPTAPPASDD